MLIMVMNFGYQAPKKIEMIGYMVASLTLK